MPTPLKNHGRIVSWDDSSQYMESHKTCSGHQRHLDDLPKLDGQLHETNSIMDGIIILRKLDLLGQFPIFETAHCWCETPRQLPVAKIPCCSIAVGCPIGKNSRVVLSME